MCPNRCETTSVLAPVVVESVFDKPGKWFVLHTKSRQEKIIAQTLNAMSISHFLPLIKRVCYYGRRKTSVEIPMFPGYLFLRGKSDDAYLADRTNRLAKIIQVLDQDLLNHELFNLHMAIQREAILNPYPLLAKGIWVEVRSGPFAGIQGQIEERTKNNRLILQVDTLGQAASLEIDTALLEPI